MNSVGMKVNFLYILVLSVLVLSPSAVGAQGRSVDVYERLSALLGKKGFYKWVEIGQLDMDGDGALDVLLKAHKEMNAITRGQWTVYFNRGAQYVVFPRASIFPMPRRNLEYRRVRQSDGQRALVWYDPDYNDGGDVGFWAFWYEKTGDDSPNLRSVVAGKNFLMSPSNDEIILDNNDAESKSRGLKIEELLFNYKRYSSKEGVPETFKKSFLGK